MILFKELNSFEYEYITYLQYIYMLYTFKN